MAAAALRMLTPVGRRAVPGPAPPGSRQSLGDRGAEAGRAARAHYLLLVPGAGPRRPRGCPPARPQAFLRQPRAGAGRDAADDRPDAGPHQDPDHRAVCAPRPGFGQGLRGPRRRQHRRRHPAAGEAGQAAAVTIRRFPVLVPDDDAGTVDGGTIVIVRTRCRHGGSPAVRRPRDGARGHFPIHDNCHRSGPGMAAWFAGTAPHDPPETGPAPRW